LAAGLSPDSLGELRAPPDLQAAVGGGVLLLRGRERREGERDGGKDGIASSLFNFWLRACKVTQKR